MPAYTYEYGCAYLHKVDAQTAGEILEGIEKQFGNVTPENVLNAARDESSPIHCEFEWNDEVAAENFRLRQARDLIGHVKLIREDQKPEEYKERAFVRIPAGTSVYTPLDKAMGNEQYRDFLLQQAKNDARRFLSKYRRLNELAKVTEELESFIQKVG